MSKHKRITTRNKYGTAVYNFDNPRVTERNCARMALDMLACFEDKIENNTPIESKIFIDEVGYYVLVYKRVEAHGELFDTKEEAEARLKELKGEK